MNVSLSASLSVYLSIHVCFEDVRAHTEMVLGNESLNIDNTKAPTAPSRETNVARKVLTWITWITDDASDWSRRRSSADTKHFVFFLLEFYTYISPRLDLLQSAAAMSFPQDRGEKKIYKYIFVSKKRILFVLCTVDGRTEPRVSEVMVTGFPAWPLMQIE